MAYEIVMPQLSDSMNEGKLISWKVKAGDSVKSGDVIAEVESDKAIMEVQTFKDGIVQELKISEGDTAPVGSVIAVIEDNSTATVEKAEVKKPKTEPKPKEIKTVKESIKKEPEISQDIVEKRRDIKIEIEGMASPRAKALAGQYGIDIVTLQKEGRLPKPTHTQDIKEFIYKRYFTPKALKVVRDYELDYDAFALNHKYRYDEVMRYIEDNDIAMPKPLSTMQKAVIDTVTKAQQKPVYHIYDFIDATLLQEYSSEDKSITVWLLKIFAQAMMDIEQFRSRLLKESIQIYPNASISLAMANGEALYMPVFRDINLKSSDEIAKELAYMKQKLKEGRVSADDLRGSTFGISNLGMTGIERFDAMINADDSGIAATGAIKNGKIAVTLTIDHRLINGWQGAVFMQRLKELAKNEDIFKG